MVRRIRTSIYIDKDLLDRVRSRGINLSGFVRNELNKMFKEEEVMVRRRFLY